MSAISDFLNTSMERLETDLGGLTMTYAGSSYACTPNTLQKGNVLVLGGKEAVVSLSLLVRQSLFGSTKPYTGKRVTYAAKTYRIIRVDSDGANTHYTLHLEDVSK